MKNKLRKPYYSWLCSWLFISQTSHFKISSESGMFLSRVNGRNGRKIFKARNIDKMVVS